MTTERLQEFAVLASTLNYSNAAQILYITQSTLSRHIAEMEDELGFQLFQRTTRNVELTEAGRRFSSSISKLLNKYDSALSRLNIQGVKASGTIKISYTVSASFPPFLEFCKHFHAKYPGIDLQLLISHEYGPQNILENELHFSPANYENLPKNVKKLHVFPQSAFLLYSPSHPLAERTSITLADLKGETLFTCLNDDEIKGPHSRVASIAQNINHNELKVVEVSNYTSAMVNVSLGQGFAILPRAQIPEEYSNLPRTKLYEPGCNFDINVYYDSQVITPAAALFLCELLPTQIPEYKSEHH